MRDIERLCPLKRPLSCAFCLFNSQQLLLSTYKDHVLHKSIKFVQQKQVFYNYQVYQPAQWSVCGNAFFIYLLLLGAFQGTHFTHRVTIHPNREAHPLARTEDFPYDTRISIQHDFEAGGPMLILCCINLQECITPPGSEVFTYGQVFTFFPDSQQETWWECHILRSHFRVVVSRRKGFRVVPYKSMPFFQYKGLTAKIWSNLASLDCLNFDDPLYESAISDCVITSTSLEIKMYPDGAHTNGLTELSCWRTSDLHQFLEYLRRNTF